MRGTVPRDGGVRPCVHDGEVEVARRVHAAQHMIEVDDDGIVRLEEGSASIGATTPSSDDLASAGVASAGLAEAERGRAMSKSAAGAVQGAAAGAGAASGAVQGAA
eukprot:CAMPEP_0174724094 /NCGR_PEP_ID=MMETSP1094-20130205/42617_1 /TAXON_ID=156173 /ORGANISM="Chrysochromulina brevifilum, Strain UTEX LB 985" /LENGTH=105 /DNA_ID=CAMNT_0015925257 /DNA_START=455 /DNA_END=769 /DNA_ORIENTATION=-